MSSEIPRRMLKVARVPMKSGTLNMVMMTPLSRPAAMPTAMASSTATAASATP